jgi:hypothetical protein
LEKVFRQSETWLGADGNYAVTLDERRTLWFFSDTWLGKLGKNGREQPKLINNSLGIMSQSNDQRSVSFAWDNSDPQQPRALLRPKSDKHWYWPFTGVAHQEHITLFAMVMEKTAASGAFGFQQVGTDLLTIENPTAPSAEWKIQRQSWPHQLNTAKRTIQFGSASFTADGYWYVYGYSTQPQQKLSMRGLVLARVALSDMLNMQRWEFRTADGWSADLAQAADLTTGMATEFSVTWMAKQQRYLLITHDAFLSPKIVGRVSETPWGPWSDKFTIYDCPEVNWSKQIFCYSAKAQPSLSTDSELIISYAANSHNLGEVIRDTRLYWPKLIRVKFE